MNVTAQDKGTGRSNKITITNEKGRLSKEEIENMVANAERFKREDELARKKIEAKNGLESFTYNMKNSLNDENVKNKLSDSDKATIEAKVQETLKWMESNPASETEQYEAKQKELEAVCNPIMMKIYQQGGMPGGMPGAGGMPGNFGAEGAGPVPPSGKAKGPSVEEVD